jgi:pyruvate dehydrogenase E1 component alpha subunit
MELQGERIADEARKQVDETVEALLDDAVRFALDSPKPDPGEALDYIYSAAVRLRGPCGQPGKREAGKQVG